MSSRALRRLQREAEERKQLEALESPGQDVDMSDQEDLHHVEQESISEARRQRNAFDFLNAQEDEVEDEDESDTGEATAAHKDVDPSISPTAAVVGSKKSNKKAKKKRKKASKTSTPLPEPEQELEEPEQELDDIDRALQSLNTKDSPSTQALRIDPGLQAFYQILSTDSKLLNPLHEMKKLFGTTVLEGDRETTANRRRGRGATQLDLAAALAGRHSQVSRGQSLAGLALRRNVLMVGKEEWPKATSGGLGMEIVEHAEDGTIEYKFVHSTIYQSVQRQFDLCVEMMDPQRMIAHLQLNPYHISTLLQVSEIAKQQGDHSVAVDLIERALFTFGRTVQSTFATSMAAGRARLDFRRPENREFWLAAYRYIGTLIQRGTWRTAFEWAKLLLSLDPEQDPYCIYLVIDQLAIRGSQFETLVKLAETPTSVLDWGQDSPNVRISLAMAYYKLKQLDKAQNTLREAISQHPWVFAGLCKELNMEPIPKAVWGRQPRTPKEELYTLSYSLRGKDIWNTPEALSFLKSVLDIATRDDEPPIPEDPSHKQILFAECRHLVVSEIPALLSLLPREMANYRTSSSDPLPPTNDIPTYNITTPEPTREEWEEEREADQQEQAGLQSWFGGILRRLGVRLGPGADENDPATVEQVAQALETSGTDLNEIALRVSRIEELRARQNIAEQQIQNLNQQQRDLVEDDTADPFQEPILPAEGLPTIRRIETPPPVDRPPLQASVEEAPDEDMINNSASAGIGTHQPLLTPSGGYDDEANQRWLAGRGLLRLKEFIAQHGSDENKWKDDLEIDITPATEYAHRITLLRNRSSREFILNYALKQGAGAEASELIRRLLA